VITDVELQLHAYDCVGTPFLWGGRDIRDGMDCVGILLYVLNKVGIRLDYATTNRAYCTNLLEDKFDKHLNPVDVTPRPGDIGLFWVKARSNVQHCGLYTERGLVHGYIAARQIVLEPVPIRWQESLHRVYAVPSVVRTLRSEVYTVSR